MKMEAERPVLLRRKIKALQTLYDINNEKMATKLHMSQRSYERRLSDPESMKVADIIRLEKVLHTDLLNVEKGNLE